MSWHTFSKEQLGQLQASLQILIQRDLLDEDEKGGARRLIRKFKGAQVGSSRLPSGELYATVIVPEEDEKLLDTVEASLWRG